MVNPDHLLSAAIHYAELGYPVFPCAPGKSTPLTEHGFHDATVDLEQIERWWSQWPNANVAIATAGLLVVDVDPGEGHSPNHWLQDEPDKQLDLATVPTSVTPRGGRHHIFRKPEGKNWRCTASRLAPHVDTRTDGGYIVAPPSARPEGQYAWVIGLELDVPPSQLPEPPAWLANELDHLVKTTTTNNAGGVGKSEIHQGTRNIDLTSWAGHLRRLGLSQGELFAALKQANLERCQTQLPEKEIESISKSLSRYAPDEIARAMAEGYFDQLVKTHKQPLAPVSLADLVTRYPDLRRPVIHGLLRQGETMNIIAAPKIGKALAVDTPILTADGWKTIADLQPGMRVHTADGSLTTIVAVSEVMYNRPCFRVTTRSGATVVADRDHLWRVVRGSQSALVTTEELAESQGKHRWLLPVNEAIQREDIPLPLDPWLLGYWLGNGTTSRGVISVNQNDLEEVVQQINQAGFTVGKLAPRGGGITFTVWGLKAKLRQLGVLGCKHIPKEYLLASKAQRAALLAGLLDADGYAATQGSHSGVVEFTTTEQSLFFSTLTLVRSLGYKACTSIGRATLNGVDYGPKLRITFAANKQSTPFRLSRRTAALPDREPSQRTRRDAVTSVTPTPSVPVKCIQVAHYSGLFLAGHDFMVTHNSWLVTDLALSVATGRPWLDTFETDQGNVLIIDNELHSETSANRIPRVAAARQLDLHEVGQKVFVQNLRGHWQDIFSLGSYFNSLEPGKFRMIILDAMYRFMPREMDENDNGTMANIYNAIDHYADLLGCCFVIINHTSKGNQSGKLITDVGAGAGSQSRATDTHLILRAHEEDDVVVLEAVVRSWPPVTPRCLRWTFPVWTPADDLDPALLRSEQPRRPRKKEEEQEWDVNRFTSTFLRAQPKLVDAILAEANQYGLSDFKSRSLLRKAEALGMAHRWDMGKGRLGYASQIKPPSPEHENQENQAGQAEGKAPSEAENQENQVNQKGAKEGGKAPAKGVADEEAAAKQAQVEALLRQSPKLSLAEIARQCGVSRQYVHKISKSLAANPGTPDTDQGDGQGAGQGAGSLA